jgi:transcriptional regulator with XRE-family HTH domain
MNATLETPRLDTFAARLKVARERTGLSARALSGMAGLGPNAVTEMESNPLRSPRLEHAAALARALGVSLTYLAFGTEEEPGRAGLAEDAAPWQPARNGERPRQAEDLDRLRRTLAPHSSSTATFVLKSDAAGFNLERGDVLVVDLKGAPKAGDLVLATVADLERGSAATVLRRYLPPYLAAPAGSTTQDPGLMADGVRTTIMGKIVASFRAPQVTG